MRRALVLLLFAANAFADTPQEHVHSMAHGVMPFDMSKTVHVFKMTVDGGIQRVEAREPRDAAQVKLIRAHLAHEAAQFAKGDFGDPAHLHGANMPGLDELAAEPNSLKVTYADIPNGGAIRFEGANIGVVTAIHRWFGAQLSEHGADARAE
jgi:hypothetical protein